MKAMEISLTGLDVEWRRLEVIANNLANMNTVKTPDGGPYRAMRLISGPKTSFEEHVGADPSNLGGVAVYGVEPSNAPPRKVHEPGNPMADQNGDVAYPDIDHAAEMVLMVKTSRAYEANLVAMNAAREMYVKSLDIGRAS
jgi:flagellar basal-body rod protein FlgC